jgi:hypothetical protein
MKIDDLGRVNSPYLTEVDDRTAFLAENALDAELLKSTAKGVGSWHLARCVVELINARKEVRRLSALKAKVFLPVFLGSGVHFPCADLLLFETVMDSARNRTPQFLKNIRLSLELNQLILHVSSREGFLITATTFPLILKSSSGCR